MKSIKADIQRNIDVADKTFKSESVESVLYSRETAVNFDLDIPTYRSSGNSETVENENIFGKSESLPSPEYHISEINLSGTNLHEEIKRCYSLPFDREVWSWR